MKRSLRYKPGLMSVGYLSEGESFSDMLKCEERYLDEKEKNPFLSDVKYFFKLSYGIVFRDIRSH